jgi:hypothetical protein
MPTNRRKIDRSKRPGRSLIVTREIIEAWYARDFDALHHACGLAVWQPSPLPIEICPSGISEDSADPDNQWDRESLRWQRELLEVAGWPGEVRARKSYDRTRSPPRVNGAHGQAGRATAQ